MDKYLTIRISEQDTAAVERIAEAKNLNRSDAVRIAIRAVDAVISAPASSEMAGRPALTEARPALAAAEGVQP